MIRFFAIIVLLCFTAQIIPVQVLADMPSVNVSIVFNTASNAANPNPTAKLSGYLVFKIEDSNGNSVANEYPYMPNIPYTRNFQLKAFETYKITWTYQGKTASKYIKVRKENQQVSILVQEPVKWTFKLWTYDNNKTKIPFNTGSGCVRLESMTSAYAVDSCTTTTEGIVIKAMPDTYRVYIGGNDFESKTIPEMTLGNTDKISNITVKPFAPSYITFSFDKPLQGQALVAITNKGETINATIPAGEQTYTITTPDYFNGETRVLVTFANGNSYNREYYITPGSKKLIQLHENYDYRAIAKKYGWDDPVTLTLCSNYPGDREIALFSDSASNSQIPYISTDIAAWSGTIAASSDSNCITTDPLPKGVYKARITVHELGITEEKTINALNKKEFLLDNPNRQTAPVTITFNVKEAIGKNQDGTLKTQDIPNFSLSIVNQLTNEKFESTTNMVSLRPGMYKVVAMATGYLPTEKNIKVYNSRAVDIYMTRGSQYRDVILYTLIESNEPIIVKGITGEASFVLTDAPNPSTGKWDKATTNITPVGIEFSPTSDTVTDPQTGRTKQKWKATVSVPTNKSMIIKLKMPCSAPGIDFDYETSMKIKVLPAAQQGQSLVWDSTNNTWINVADNPQGTPEFIFPVNLVGRVYDVYTGERNYSDSMSLEKNKGIILKNKNITFSDYHFKNAIVRSDFNGQLWLPDNTFVSIEYETGMTDANLFREAAYSEYKNINFYDHIPYKPIFTQQVRSRGIKKLKTPIDIPANTNLSYFACDNDTSHLCAIWITETASDHYEGFLELNVSFRLRDVPVNKYLFIDEDSFYISEKGNSRTRWRDTAHNIISKKEFASGSNTWTQEFDCNYIDGSQRDRGVWNCLANGTRIIGIPKMTNLEIKGKVKLAICDEHLAENPNAKCIKRTYYFEKEDVASDDKKAATEDSQNSLTNNILTRGYSRYNKQSGYAFASLSADISFSEMQPNEKYIPPQTLQKKFIIGGGNKPESYTDTICNCGTNEYYENFSARDNGGTCGGCSQVGTIHYQVGDRVYIVPGVYYLSTSFSASFIDPKYNPYGCNPNSSSETITSLVGPFYDPIVNLVDVQKALGDFCSTNPTYTNSSSTCGNTTHYYCKGKELAPQSFMFLNVGGDAGQFTQANGQIKLLATRPRPYGTYTNLKVNPIPSNYIEKNKNEVKVTVVVRSHDNSVFPTGAKIKDLDNPDKFIWSNIKVEIETDKGGRTFELKTTGGLSNLYQKTFSVEGSYPTRVVLRNPWGQTYDFGIATSCFSFEPKLCSQGQGNGYIAEFRIDPNQATGPYAQKTFNIKIKATTDKTEGFAGKKVYVRVNPYNIPTGRKITQGTSNDSYFWAGGERYELPVNPDNPKETKVVTIQHKGYIGDQLQLLFTTSDSENALFQSVITEGLKKKINEMELQKLDSSLDAMIAAESALDMSEQKGLIGKNMFTWLPKTVTLNSEEINVNGLIPYFGQSPTEPKTYQFRIKVRSDQGFKADLLEVASILTIFMGGGWSAKLAKVKAQRLKDARDVLAWSRDPWLHRKPDTRIITKNYEAYYDSLTKVIEVVDKTTGEVMGPTVFGERVEKYIKIVSSLEKLEEMGTKLKKMFGISELTKQHFTTLATKLFKPAGKLAKTLLMIGLPTGGLAPSGMPTIFLKSGDEATFYTPEPEGSSGVLTITTWLTNFFNKPLSAKEAVMYVKAKPGRSIILKILAPGHMPYTEIIKAPDNQFSFTKDITLYRTYTLMNFDGVQTFFDTHPLFQEYFEELTGTPELYPTNSERSSTLIDYMSQALADLVMNLAQDFSLSVEYTSDYTPPDTTQYPPCDLSDPGTANYCTNNPGTLYEVNSICQCP